MPVVSVRDNNDPKLTHGQVADIVHTATGVFFTSFRKNQRGYAAYMETSADKEKLLDPANRKVMERSKVEVIKPPDYRAACTIIINGAGHTYRTFGEAIMKKELEEAMNADISFMAVFGSKLRVELNSPDDAKRILEAGEIKGDAMTFRDIEKARYSKVPQCSRCYSYAHERMECPSREQLCFICAEPGHDDLTCPSKDKPKCRNCLQDHVAIAFKCPFRKVRLFELDERSDCDLETLVMVDHMRRILGEKSPLTSEDEASEAGSEDTIEGAAALDSDASGENSGASSVARYYVLLKDIVKETVDKVVSDYEKKAWKAVRILKAPDPEKGEGPNRTCRKIANFTPLVVESSAPLTFPALPPRRLRKIAA